MPIPEYREDGSLPPGEHLATWQELAERFGWNERRRRLLEGLQRALAELHRVGCVQAFVDGSFVTDREEPEDYDGCWDETGVDILSLDRAMRDLRWPRAAMKAKYHGEMFPANAPADARLTRFREFLQRDRDDNPKGIVVIDMQRGGP